MNTQDFSERLVRLETSVGGLVDELKEVVTEMRESTKTQVEILVELKSVKPRVDTLTVDMQDMKAWKAGQEAKQELAGGIVRWLGPAGVGVLIIALAALGYVALK